MEATLGDCFLQGGKEVNRSSQVAFFPPDFFKSSPPAESLQSLKPSWEKSESGDCLPLPASRFSVWRKSARSPDAAVPPPPPRILPGYLLFDYSSTSSMKMQGRGVFFSCGVNWFVLRGPQQAERKFTCRDASQTALVFSCLGAKEVAYTKFCNKSTREKKAAFFLMPG